MSLLENRPIGVISFDDVQVLLIWTNEFDVWVLGIYPPITDFVPRNFLPAQCYVKSH